MNYFFQTIFCFVIFCAFSASAQLSVTVSPPKIAGQRAVVELKMRNQFDESVKSARAICFLLDQNGKMIGESAKWVIGGKKDQPALEPKIEASFNIIITSPRPFATTNLSAKVSFTRLILESGKSVNPNENVAIAQELPPTNQVSHISSPLTRVSATNNLATSTPLDDVIASASERITNRPPARTSEAVMITNLPKPINPPHH